MGAIKINPAPAQGTAFIEVGGKQYQVLCRLIFLQFLIGPHFEPGLSLRLDAALQALEALEERRRGGPVRVGGVVRRVMADLTWRSSDPDNLGAQYDG